MTLIEDIRQKKSQNKDILIDIIAKYDTPLKGYFLSQILYKLLKRNQSQRKSNFFIRTSIQLRKQLEFRIRTILTKVLIHDTTIKIYSMKAKAS